MRRRVWWYKLVGQLVGHQLVVGPAGWAALGLPLVEPEPHHGRVVLFTCRERRSGEEQKHMGCIENPSIRSI